MDNQKHPDYSDAYQKIYGSLEEKKTGMSSDAMGSVLKGNKYSSKELFNMSKKSTAQGRHGEAHALYKEFQRKKTTKEGYQRDPDRQEKDRKTSKQTDPSKDGFTGIGDSIEDIMKQNAAMKAAAEKKTKKEEVGRHRAEFERYKAELKEHHAEKFNAWVQKLQEDGFDISRWEPQELIDTYIKENNLWKSRETIEEAVGDGYPARIEGPQKGLGTALCPICGQFGCTKSHEEQEEEITEQELESQRAMRVAGMTIPNLPDPDLKEAPSPIQDPSTNPDLVTEGKAYGLWKGDGKVKLPGKRPLGTSGTTAPTKKRVKEEIELEESEKVAQGAYKRAEELGSKRRRASYKKTGSNSGSPGKNERAGYNLSQSARSRNADLETQGGPQTGGGPKSYGFAKNKKNPVKSKKSGDTGAEGHYKKRDQKVTSKSGKTTRYKLKFSDRLDHHVSKRQELKDPKKNPKHTANTKKEEYSDWRLDILGEEGYDHWRDKQLEKYGTGWRGTDRSGPSSRPSSSKKTKGKTVLQRETEKKYGKGKSALDIVKAKIEAEHGKGAIMDTKKKKK